jgi:hypothetical protein
MPPKLAALKADEVTAFGLRLMRSFLALRSKRRREEVIAFAERLLEEERKAPAETSD